MLKIIELDEKFPYCISKSIYFFLIIDINLNFRFEKDSKKFLIKYYKSRLWHNKQIYNVSKKFSFEQLSDLKY